MSNEMKRILVTGAAGQIGSDLLAALSTKHGAENVIASDIRPLTTPHAGPFETIDVTYPEMMDAIVDKYEIDTIYHLAAILSAVGEEKPQLCWDINVSGLYNILELARKKKLTRIFCPSSIAVFGCETPCDQTPQDTILSPSTMYGVTKVAGEQVCNYYAQKLGVDVRGLRYPGLISSEALPGGGTTDYAVAIYYEAVEKGNYTCFVSEGTVLPMMYMPDAIKATLELMEADFDQLKHNASYNLAAMSFSAGELAVEIKKHIPHFEIEYRPDFRQDIADSWPHSIDDRAAREEWGWQPEYNLAAMTADMLEKLGERHAKGNLYP